MKEPKLIKPILIGIAGGSTCGKLTLLNEIKSQIKNLKYDKLIWIHITKKYQKIQI